MEEVIEDLENSAPVEVGRKGKKSRRKKDDWEDDVARDLENMALEEAGEKVDEAPENQLEPAKKEKVLTC